MPSPAFPTINGQVKTVLRWYREEALVSINREECAEELADCDFSLWTPRTNLLPFQFWVPVSNEEVTSWVVLDMDGSVVLDLATDISKLSIVKFATLDYIVYDGAILSSLLPEGFYTSQITQNGVINYSEVFRVMCSDGGGLSEDILTNGAFDTNLLPWTVGDETDVAHSSTLVSGAPTEPSPFQGMIVLNFADDTLYRYEFGLWVLYAPSEGDNYYLQSEGVWYEFTGGAWAVQNPAPFSWSGPGRVCWSGSVSPSLIQADVFTGKLSQYVVIIDLDGVSQGSLAISLGNGTTVTLDADFSGEVYLNSGTGTDVEIVAYDSFDGCLNLIEVRRITTVDCHLGLQWTNCGSVGQLYYENGFVNRFYFDQRVFVSEPAPRLIIEGDEDGQRNFYESFRRKEIEYRIEVGFVPWYVADALSEVPLHDTIQLVSKNSAGTDTMKRVRVEVDWDPAHGYCLARVTIFFQLDEASISSACCTLFDPPCPEACETVIDDTDHVPDPPDEGWYVVIGQPKIRYSDGADLGDAQDCESRLVAGTYTASNKTGYPDSYFDTSSNAWLPIAILLLEYGDGCTSVKLNAYIMPRYRARIQASVDQVNWVNTTIDYSAAEWAAGLTGVNMDPEWGYVRLEVYFDDCILGHSAIHPLLCECPVEMSECSYFQDFRSTAGEAQTGYTVTSFKVDAVEQLTAPVPFDSPLNVIDVGGLPFVTNMIDALNACAVQCFFFYPANENAIDLDITDFLRYFRIRRPTSVTTFEIIISAGVTNAYRYTETGFEVWDGAAWITGFAPYEDGAVEDAKDCLTLTP